MRTREDDTYKKAKEKMLEDKAERKKERDKNLVLIDKNELDGLKEELKEVNKPKELGSGE